MTEYKKLCSLLLQLREETSALVVACDDGGVEDAAKLHQRAVLIKSLIVDGRCRVVKLLRKAQEKDPNRQIYNERMCLLIEQLFEEFCDVVAVLFGDRAKGLILSEEGLPFEESLPLSWAEDCYDRHLILLAQSEAWRKRLANDLTELSSMEEEARALHVALEKQDYSLLLRQKRETEAQIQQLLDERRQAKWEAEKERREKEHEGLLSSSISSDAALAFTLLESVPEPFRRKLASHLLCLVRALRSTPEDFNIRHIRCSNLRVLTEYSHLSFCSECKTCGTLVSAVEVLLYVLGYRLHYSSLPVPPLISIMEANPAVRLPCGRLLSEHRVALIGFEDYSERLFVLNEPNPAEKPTEWMEWYARTEALMHRLEAASL
ncbi:hypothetical protein ERJ75_000332500 [Trypanosoma vivax]|uniref:Uncharacterized protein n=1 Tax=Trypanosoma vivax (strain Y486) TaxID=1055687 RepID=G0UAK5_TRYVY|nr:hypothetical protein ERJ75_000332500 [Trypanosoma vivax]CCC52838.1 conserved hypothetical protein [Trypanosoma vivax Y486]